MSGRRRRVLALLAALAAVALVARVLWVNASLPRIPERTYEQGEWVPLEGAFQYSSSEEETDGYSLCVLGARLMTYEGFLSEYGDGLPAGEEPPGHGRCVVDVAVGIRNDGTGQGSLDAFDMLLVPERGNEYLLPDMMGSSALWPRVQEGGVSPIVSVRPGTQVVVHIPYVFNGGDETYSRDVEDIDFTLLVSRMPERKMIRVHLDG